jgi:two-component system nitrogen regulation response regulator GlnG
VLQEQQFERVGGSQPLRTDVRVLAATNHDLERLADEGRFRRDLYYRLKVATICVPPLRDRLEDVAELAHYFLFLFNRELGRDYRGLSPDALELLQRYHWPGNVRELQSTIKEAMLHATGHLLTAEFLPAGVRACRPQLASKGAAGGLDLVALIEEAIERGGPDVYDQVVRAVERELLTRALRHTHGHQARASQLLGLNRSTLRAKLRELGIALDKVPTDEQPDASPPV